MPKGIYKRTKEMKTGLNKNSHFSFGHKINLGRKWSKEIIEKRSEKIRGEKSPEWKGNKVSYSGLHKWISKKLGKPMLCENCHRINLTSRQYHWANISGKYHRILSDWKRLCVRCHKNMDMTRHKTITEIFNN